MDWVGSALQTFERWVVAGFRWGRTTYYSRRPWTVELVPLPDQGYLPAEYIGDETLFQLRNNSKFDVVAVVLAVKLGKRLPDGRVPIADMGIAASVAAGEAAPATSFPDQQVGKTRLARVTWLDSRGQHRQQVRIRSLGTYEHRW